MITYCVLVRKINKDGTLSSRTSEKVITVANLTEVCKGKLLVLGKQCYKIVACTQKKL